MSLTVITHDVDNGCCANTKVSCAFLHNNARGDRCWLDNGRKLTQRHVYVKAPKWCRLRHGAVVMCSTMEAMER